MTAFPSYSTGTVAIGAAATAVIGTSTIWTGTNAKPGDTLVCAGHEVTIIDVIGTGELLIEAWPYSAVTAGSSYKIIKNSPLRFAGADAMASVNYLVSGLNTDGFFFYVPLADSEPDPSLGNDGQYALKPTTGEIWLKDGGVWVSDGGMYFGSSIAFTPTGGISATTVSGAIAELDIEKAAIADLSAVAFSGSGSDISSGNMGLTSLAIVAGTLIAGATALSLTATQPTSPVATQIAVSITVTGAGSAAFGNRALGVTYNAGYTGSSTSAAGIFVNNNLGTGATNVSAAGANTFVGNFGLNGNAQGITTGTNFGTLGIAGNGNVNFGLSGSAQIAKNGATNIGVQGTAINSGTTPVMVGGWFHLNQTTVPVVSAALIADNGSQALPIFLARDNGTTVFSIDDGGHATFANASILNWKDNGGTVCSVLQLYSDNSVYLDNNAGGNLVLRIANTAKLTITGSASAFATTLAVGGDSITLSGRPFLVGGASASNYNLLVDPSGNNVLFLGSAAISGNAANIHRNTTHSIQTLAAVDIAVFSSGSTVLTGTLSTTGNTVIKGSAVSNGGNQFALSVTQTAGGNLAVVHTAALGASSGGTINMYANAVPTAADQRLGSIVIGSTDLTTSRNSVSIAAFSSQAWTAGTAHGSYLNFNVAANGAAGATTVIRMYGSGGIVLGASVVANDPGYGVFGMGNVSVAPSTSPSGMGQLYVEAGALKYRGSSGTVTTLGNA